MLPDPLFPIANFLAMAGWLVLALSPLSPRWSDRVAGVAIPLILSVGYTALILAFWSRAPGGFDSLANVMALFTMPQIALAGWVHYLAFDLLIGAWIARTARAERVPHLLVLPCLALTFLFGPVGYLTFTLIRASRSLPAPLVTEPR
jgi:O-antigen ligase